MKKIALFAALTFAAPAFAEQPMVASHITAMERLALSFNAQMLIEPLAYSVTTTTQGVVVPKVVVMQAGDGTEDAPAAVTDGLDLTGLSGVTVMMKTSGNATAGGTLQAYVMNPETSAWYRVADLDLTATATTVQSWPGIWVPVARGRVTWIPNGIGSVVTTVYLIGQEK